MKSLLVETEAYDGEHQLLAAALPAWILWSPERQPQCLEAWELFGPRNGTAHGDEVPTPDYLVLVK